LTSEKFHISENLPDEITGNLKLMGRETAFIIFHSRLTGNTEESPGKAEVRGTFFIQLRLLQQKLQPCT